MDKTTVEINYPEAFLSSSTMSASASTLDVRDVTVGFAVHSREKIPSGDSWDQDPELTAAIIIQIIFLIFLSIFGTCINSLVFWIFNRRPALRSLSNRFVLSLVTANLLISCIVSPLILFETIMSNYIILPCITEGISTLANSVIFSAIFSTFLIATDRFYAVTSPLHYSMTITRSRSQIMIIVAWISGILLSFPMILLCVLPTNSEIRLSLQIITTVLQVSVGYAFPLISLCWLYLRMYHAAHRNSERTRKHSISGELLTVMDGSTSVIPQGIDFLTHYMNPFAKPMVGSVIPAGQVTGTGVVIAVKKQRRRSSNGSSSSLLFREEGRAIKTAFFVLASFLFCWTPHFTLMLLAKAPEITDGEQLSLKHRYGNWGRFISITGMMLSSVLNPFIYVFRNKMACKELTKLLCGFVQRRRNKQGFGSNSTPAKHAEHISTSRRYDTSEEQEEQDPPLHVPPTPLPKAARRSSMKSLTPQSSFNSNSTQINLAGRGSNDSTISESPIMFLGISHTKPPFLRSMTLPEQTHQPRVKFPPNLLRQKSTVQRTVSEPPTDILILNRLSHQQARLNQKSSLLSPTHARRSKFIRQDSICSILSTDSVLMICPEDSCEPHEPPILSQKKQSFRREDELPWKSNNDLNLSSINQSSGFQETNQERSNNGQIPILETKSELMNDSQTNDSYARQDSNYSDKTNDSGVVSDYRASSTINSTNQLSRDGSNSFNNSTTITYPSSSPEFNNYESSTTRINGCVKELKLLQTAI